MLQDARKTCYKRERICLEKFRVGIFNLHNFLREILQLNGKKRKDEKSASVFDFDYTTA